MVEKVKLTGGPDNSVTWVWLDPTDSRLKVEYYDFSKPAQKFFGNDRLDDYRPRHGQPVLIAGSK